MRLADVQVDVGIWSLDRPLTYSVPERFAHRIQLGSIVRVPLKGRRVRGWVVGIGNGVPEVENLHPISGVSGPAPVFDESMLEVARELARYYVHPLSSFLDLITPSQMGRGRTLENSLPARKEGEGRVVLKRLAVGVDPVPIYVAGIEKTLSGGRGSIVAVPEVREGSAVIGRLMDHFGPQAAVVHSGVDPSARALALWDVACGKKKVVLGGTAAVFAPAFPIGLMIIHREHDDSYKARRSPYYDARVVAVERGRKTGADLWFSSETPSLFARKIAAAGIAEDPPREFERTSWPIVEVVDPVWRGLPRRAIAAIIEARKKNERVFVLLPRAQATASGWGPAEIAQLVERIAPKAKIGRGDRAALGSKPGHLAGVLRSDIVIATEAALNEVERPDFKTAIALGIDSWLKRPYGRALEDAFATLWTLASMVSGRPKGRLILETENPGHYMVQALTRGDYHYFAEHELGVRRSDESPPFVSLVRVHMAADSPKPSIIENLERLPETAVLGPVPGRLGWEVLLRVKVLDEILDPLRQLVSSSGQEMLVEVDPREW